MSTVSSMAPSTAPSTAPSMTQLPAVDGNNNNDNYQTMGSWSPAWPTNMRPHPASREISGAYFGGVFTVLFIFLIIYLVIKYRKRN